MKEREVFRAVVVAICVFGCMVANGVNVRNTVSKNDPRWMSTGCKYENAFSSAGSMGIWVRNVSDSSDLSCLMGCTHVNQNTYPGEGFLLFIDHGTVKFKVVGSDSGGTRREVNVAASDSSFLNDGDWHFILGTFDISAGKVYLFVDGEQSGTEDISIASIRPSRCLTASICGKTTEATTNEKDNYGAGFLGLFAELTLWNRALSAADAATLTTRRAFPWENGLIGYWPLAADNKNWALNAVTRADGSRPNAMFYYASNIDDADFFNFDMPSGKYVVSPEWSAAHGYVMPEDATFGTIVDPATNIQAAVNAATSGQTVYVLPGTYPLESPVAITNKNLTLTSWDVDAAAPDRDATILDGQLRTRVVDVYNNNANYKIVVHGFTITNGANCAVVLLGGNPSQTISTALSKNNFLENCRVTGCVRSGDGTSAVYVSRLGVVTNCVINGNRAANGCVIGWTTDYGANHVQYIGKDYMFRRVTFTDCDIEDNVNAGKSNTALGGTNCGIIDRCRFRRNYNTGYDTVVYTAPSGSSVFDCIFEDTPGTAADAVKPERIFNIGGGHAVVSNCIIRGNSAKNYVFACLDTPPAAKVWHTTVTNNTAGTALIGRMEVRNSLIVGNGSGQGAWSHNKPGFIIENTTITGFGNGVYVPQNVTNIIVNSIVYGNTKDINFTAQGSSLYVTNSVIGNIPTHTAFAEEYVNRYTFDPLFTDAAHGDYTLMRYSPCREKGVRLDWMTADSLDLADLPRVVDVYGVPFSAEARPDLGCYEIQDFVPGTMIIFR